MIAGNMSDYSLVNWWRPLAELERMTRQMDRLMHKGYGGREGALFTSKVFPAVNITEDNDKYYVRAELPGIKADDIKLEIAENNLVIAGERTIQSEGDNARYHRRERDEGRFSRVIRLSKNVNAESVDAIMVNGILTVAIEKSEASKPRKITVK